MTLPLSDEPVNAQFYEDLNTRCVYELDVDPDSPTFGSYNLVSCPQEGGEVTVGPTPPTSPAIGDIWIDSSVTPSVSYIWDGSSWVSQSGVPGPPGPPGPPGGVDTTPPPPPVIIGAPTSDVTQQEDGTTVVRISAVVGYATSPGLIDLARYEIESTREITNTNPPLPDWSYATTWAMGAPDKTGAGHVTITQPGVLPGAVYYWRAYAVDQSDNRSTPSAEVQITAGADTTGPARPSNIVVQPGMSSIGVMWGAIPDADLAYTEVQWQEGATGNWSSLQTGGTLVVITGLKNDVLYNLRLRSVDTSGNTLHQTGTDVDGLPVYAIPSPKASDPDVGWVAAASATPTALPGSALVWSDAVIASVFAGKINADWIDAGTLKVGVGTGNALGIEVYNNATPPKLVGRWNGGTLNPDGTANLDGKPNGIEIYDPANASKYKLRLTESSLVIYNDLPNATQVVSITPLGIDAASVTFGAARGGHNLLNNSSFEMGGYPTAGQQDTAWDLAADWNASRVGADTNITVGASVLSITAVT